MGYEAKIKVDGYGIVQQDSLTALTSKDWETWIDDQIHGNQRVMFSRDKGDYSTTSIFTDLIPGLEVSERLKAYNGIAKCLVRVYKYRKDGSNESKWNDIRLDDLLSLVGGVETRFEGHDCTHQDTYFAGKVNDITRFLDVVEPRPSFEFSETRRDLYFRTLQSLCGIEAKLPYGFWLNHLEKSPSVYASVCFSGATNNSPYDGISILSRVDWSNERTRGRMQSVLMFFYYDHHRNEEVIGAIERRKLELPEEVQSVFIEAKKEADELVEKYKLGEF